MTTPNTSGPVPEKKKVKVPGVASDPNLQLKSAIMKQQLEETKIEAKKERAMEYEEARNKAEPLFREYLAKNSKGGMEAWNEMTTAMYVVFQEILSLSKAFGALYGVEAGKFGPLLTMAKFADDKLEELTGFSASGMMTDVSFAAQQKLDAMELRNYKMPPVSYNVSVDEKGKLACTAYVDHQPCIDSKGNPNPIGELFEQGVIEFLKHKGYKYDKSTGVIKNKDGSTMKRADIDTVMADFKNTSIEGLHAYMETLHNISIERPSSPSP